MNRSGMRQTGVSGLRLAASLFGGTFAAAFVLAVYGGSAPARAVQDSKQPSGKEDPVVTGQAEESATKAEAERSETLQRKRSLDLRPLVGSADATPTQAASPRTVLAMPSGGGRVDAATGWAHPVPASVKLLAEPPKLTPELRAMIERARQHELLPGRPLPVTGSPEQAVPTSPPTPPAGAPNVTGQIAAPETFQYFVNAPVTPAGASTGVVAEPSVANNGKFVFQTGNWYAALSDDNGNTWQFVSPYTSFPSVNGGFCCDQIVIYHPAYDTMIWLLQYSSDGTNNTHRFAVAKGVSSLGHLNWCLYDFTPANVGIDSGNLFDFPDLVVGNSVIYWTTNVYTTATFCQGGPNDASACSSVFNCQGYACDHSYVTSVVARLPVNEMSQCAGFGFGYWNQLGFDLADRRASWRGCHGTGSVFYWATHNSTSSMRIFRWEEGSGSITWNDVTHDAFGDDLNNMTCPGPDGTDSCARADTRILGAYNNGLGELGFMWISPAHGGFPYPYTRIVRVQESDRALISNEVIWYDHGAWTYPSVAVNARGHLAGTIFYAGESMQPQCDVWIADDFSPSYPSIAPAELHLLAQGTNGPAANKWGDYLTARPHAPFSNTWIASGYTLQGGTTQNYIEPRHVWFGRERDTPPPAPSNDECMTASVILATPFVQDIDTRGATAGKDDPLPGCTLTRNSNTVWYTYTVPCDGTVTIETCNSNYDTVLTVYTGNCTDLTEVACDDDDAGCADSLQSRIADLALTADQTLYIEVADYNRPAGGDLHFTFEFTPAADPPNDDCANATFVAVPSSTPGTTRCAEFDPEAPDCETGTTAPGVWYRVRGTGRTMTATVCDAQTEAYFDSKITVYCDHCGSLTGQHCVADNDDDCADYPGQFSTVTWCSRYGASYLILVHGFGGSVGNFMLNVYDDGAPCVDAVDCGGSPIGACCIHGAGECTPGICGEFLSCGGTCICGLTSEGDGACFGGFQICDFLTPCPNGTSDCDAGEICWVGSCCDGPVCSRPCTGGSASDTGEPVDLALTPMGAESADVSTAGFVVTCLEMPQETCGYAGGIFAGNGVACEPDVCLAACCVAGSCIGELSEYACEQSGGTWHYGDDCATVDCPPPTGACCPGVVCTSSFTCGEHPSHYSCNGVLGCICAETTEGGVTCVDAMQGCGAVCRNGTIDCPRGEMCVVGSCCNDGAPTCVVDGCPTMVATAVEPGVPRVGYRDALAEAAGVQAGGCLEIEEGLCIDLGAEYQGDLSTCQPDPCPAPGACCLPDANCLVALASECVALGGAPMEPGTPCDPGVCDILGACCVNGACVGDSDELTCLREEGEWFINDSCADFTCPVETEACCSPDGQACRDDPPDVCLQNNGTPQGPGTWCLGDTDRNGLDDACEIDEPCQDCGPGPHWVDRCDAGSEHMPSGAMVGIDMDGDCIPERSLRLTGPMHVRRTDPLDDSGLFPGLAPIDGHLDVIDTEITALAMSGDGVLLTAGGGLGAIPLRRSFGAIAEQAAAPSYADSFFDLYVEVDFGGGLVAYNQDPVRVASLIDCVPPNTTYIHVRECVKLVTSPHPGEGEVVAYLTTADHSTYPDCGDPVSGPCLVPHEYPHCSDEACCERVCSVEPRCCTESWSGACADIASEVCLTQACCDPASGRCQDVPPDVCELELHGTAQGFGTRCQGDADQDGRDDACQPERPCEDCGPAAHWIDECRADTDRMDIGAMLGIDTDGDCVEDRSFRLSGSFNVVRSDPMDDSVFFPGSASVDGHRDVIDTEILSLNLTDGGMTMVAGGGMGQGGALRRSKGAIVEQSDDAGLGESFFDVFFEIDLGGGTYVYNHTPLRVAGDIDCVPAETTYVPEFDCIDLFDAPIPGTGEVVAHVVGASYSTGLACGEPGAGSCFEANGTPACSDGPCCEWVCAHLPTCCEVEWDGRCAEAAMDGCPTRQACCLQDGSCANLTPQECVGDGGVPRGPKTECQGDCNQNGIDDACEILGDLNDDELVNLADWRLFAACLTGPNTEVLRDCLRADFNCDGKVDMVDAWILVPIIHD